MFQNTDNYIITNAVRSKIVTITLQEFIAREINVGEKNIASSSGWAITNNTLAPFFIELFRNIFNQTFFVNKLYFIVFHNSF